ncbi:MAG: PAS domain S-box protein, partial [Nitrospira sp.]|nr:PAS domain S-box protein [Nitrospira sp.]
EVIGILGIYDDITERKETDFALQQSIERFNLAVQASRDGLWDIYLIANDPFNDENPIYYSPRMKEIMGIATTTGPNRLGEWSALIHPDDRERIFAALTAHLTQRTPYDIEYRIITNSGDSKWIAAKGQAQWSASGIPIRMSGSFSDITARMHAEEQLRLTQVTMDRLSEAIFWIDRSANICYVNESACRMLGYSQEELLALSVPDIDPHFPADAWPSHWAELRQRGNFTFESAHRTKSGSLFQTEVTVNYLEFQGKEFNCAIMRDVTERKRAEQALQDNRELLNSILDSTPSAVFALDRQQRFTLLNNVTAQILDLSKDEILGKTLYDVLPQDLANRLQLANSHILASGTSQFTEEFFSGKDTHLPRHVLSSKFPLRDAQGNIVGLGNVSTDVTEYKQAERALAESEERFRILFEQAAVGVAQIDAATGRFVRVNRKFCDITGYGQAKMLTFDTRELTHQDDWEVLQQHLRQLMSGDVREFMLEQRFLCINGTVAWVKLVVSPMWQPGATPDFVIVVAQDITERKQAEESLQIFQEQIRQMQKQEALGQLAGGIAHDFNNLLTAILGNAEIVGRKLATDHPSRPNLSRILEAGNRASQLVQQILTFTRQQEVTRTAQSLAPIITEALGLLRATIPASVALTSTVDIATPSVMADATQLHQVIMNLCTNAWHAMKDRHGSIMINLAPITLTEPLHSLQTTLPPGTYAHLSVGDTGCGIEADILERIFDPFFTTKPVGQGTGLGLSVVQGIIQGHDGAIVVESQPGRGTTFHLYFPAASTGEPANAPHTSTASPLEGQGRHLLYVDDEAMLVELIAARFEPLGYRVTGLTSATKALETIRAHPQDVDVVVTDYNMPEMSGLEIAQAVAAIRADLPVVLVSGYLSPEAQAAALAAEIKGIVYKPTMLQQLGDVVAKLFDSPPPTR